MIATRKLAETIGAEVLDVDRERLVGDAGLGAAVREALEEFGVLVFRDIGVSDEEMVAFGRRLGDLVARPGRPVPEITAITQSPEGHLADYFRGNLYWHVDGMLDPVPCKAGILAARVVSPSDGGTEFASTYAAYDDLSEDERARYEGLRVVHSMEATLRPIYPDPTPEQIAFWRQDRPVKEHPLVWAHSSGRKSLVMGATADYVVGMDEEEGRALLADLLSRATRPERVLRHDWTVGDMVVWDNTGALHRVTDYDPTSTRELHRATVAGEEPVQ